MVLLTQRCLVEMEMELALETDSGRNDTTNGDRGSDRGSENAAASSTSSTEDTSTQAKVLVLFRQQIREMLQRQPRGLTDTTNGDRGSDRGSENDMRLWCVYAQAEAAVGEAEEAIKVG
jgi:hypothetical protein